MIDLSQASQTTTLDPLFVERLQAFLEKSLSEIKSFSERENTPFEEIRRHVAQWHSSYLFGHKSQSKSWISTGERREYIRSVLCETSRILESLHSLSGIHTFFLTVDPNDATDEGFLGGTVLGREFWRGFRGGGDAGAKNFRSHCLKKSDGITMSMAGIQNNNLTSNEISSSSSGAATTITSKRSPASSLKAEVYANVRDALRSTSGIRTAEMKWSNHARLSAYDVYMIGWPPSIPQQNPSLMTAGQNKLLLEALADGSMRFERIDVTRVPQTVSDDGKGGGEGVVSSQENTDISWAYEDKPGGPSTPNRPSGPITQPPLTWTDDQAGPSRSAQHQHTYPGQISPTLPDDITDPASYLSAYDMECINDFTKSRHPEFSSPNIQPFNAAEGQLSDGFVDTQEFEGTITPESSILDGRSPKKRRINEDG